MIKNTKGSYASVKELREKERAEEEKKLRDQCEELACEKYTHNKVVEWSNKYLGLWYLPIINDDGTIAYMLVMKPINRHVLSYASTKLTDEGLYSYLEVCMRECFIEGDQEIFDEEDCFLAAADKFNKILGTRKAALLKR